METQQCVELTSTNVAVRLNLFSFFFAHSEGKKDDRCLKIFFAFEKDMLIDCDLFVALPRNILCSSHLC